MDRLNPDDVMANPLRKQLASIYKKAFLAEVYPALKELGVGAEKLKSTVEELASRAKEIEKHHQKIDLKLLTSEHKRWFQESIEALD